ncbi:MAG: hypothetical protein MHM6MM_006857 [Cercozoa sp. M6MM]
MSEALDNVAVVVDNGSCLVKAGVAGTDKAQVVAPSLVGTAKYPQAMLSAELAVQDDTLCCERASEMRGVLRLRRPLRTGATVADWNDLEKVWRHVYGRLGALLIMGVSVCACRYKYLPVRVLPCKYRPASAGVSAREHPLLLGETPLRCDNERLRTAELAFDALGVPALHIAAQPILSLYASGRTTGAVLDVGHTVSHCVPIFEGFAVPHAVQRVDLAGQDVDEELRRLLARSGHRFDTSAELEVVRAIKEATCVVPDDFAAAEKRLQDRLRQQMRPRRKTHAAAEATSAVPAASFLGGDIETTYRLPDGNSVTLGAERYRATQVLFDPTICGKEHSGVHHLVTDAVTRCDLDLRQALYNTVVLAGGSTCLSGFPQRLGHELRQLLPRGVAIKVVAPRNRQQSAWIGGSILASLGTFRRMWVTRQDFDECGASIFARKGIGLI